jgi:signal transduction histidine kinase
MLGDEVEDDGPGLDPEAAQSAVGRGIRFDADAPGSGLGLSIAAGLTELYSGTLTLERGRISTDDQVGDVMLVEQREQISEV